MGIEAEHDVRDPNGRVYNDLIERLIQESVFERAGIEAHIQTRQDSFLLSDPEAWLANGARFYIDRTSTDGGTVDDERAQVEVQKAEYCTPEVEGPRHLVIALRAGHVVMQKLVEVSSISDARVYLTGGTINEDGETATSGLHFNFLVDAQIDTPDNREILESHHATQIYAWGGGIGQEDYVLSPKALSVGRPILGNKGEAAVEGKKPVGTFHWQKSDHAININSWIDGKVRYEDRTKENTTDWGVFTGAGTTSLVLRVLELAARDPEGFGDLRQRLADLTIADPIGAMHASSRDLSLSQKHVLKNGQQMTAIEIQAAMADIAEELSNRVALPEDELMVIREWKQICRDLAKVAEVGKFEYVADRVGWALRYVAVGASLRHHGHDTRMRASNTAARKYSLLWDRTVPSGSRSKVERKVGKQIVSEDEIRAAVRVAPSGRGIVRGEHITNPRGVILSMSWGRMHSLFAERHGRRVRRSDVFCDFPLSGPHSCYVQEQKR